MPGDDHRAPLGLLAGDDQIEQLVEPGQHARDAAAARQIDHRVADGGEDVARGDHVRAPEEHHAVAVRMRGRQVDHLHGLAVVEEVLARAREGLRRPGRDRRRRLRPGGRAEPVEGLLVGDDLGPRPEARAHLGDAASRRRQPRRPDLLVAPHVVRVRVGVDDVAHRPRGQCPDRREQGIGARGRAGVDDDRPEVADLHDDVGPGSDDDVHTALHVHCVRTGVARRRCRRGRGLAVAGHARGQRARQHGGRDRQRRDPTADFPGQSFQTRAAARGAHRLGAPGAGIFFMYSG